MSPQLFRTPLQVVNVGIEEFANTLREQSVPVVEVAWQPPASGNMDMVEILKQLFGAPGGSPRGSRGGCSRPRWWIASTPPTGRR